MLLSFHASTLAQSLPLTYCITKLQNKEIKNKQDLGITLQFTLKLRAVAKVHHKRWSDAAFCYLSRGNKLCKDVQGLRHGKNIVSLICQPVLHHTIDCTNDDNQKNFLPTRSSMVTLDSVAVEIARPVIR
ncbi:hypothetical protein D917_02593 [Trichinella nativa]|uniref:Uncharacterized protein n=1 Tax=Trichinella nativa TaxID=6335 RepID=A0A1Y3EE53_9BILA|nr:hypothetical protein D917_02593 [Trichinella nativa]